MISALGLGNCSSRLIRIYPITRQSNGTICVMLHIVFLPLSWHNDEQCRAYACGCQQYDVITD